MLNEKITEKDFLEYVENLNKDISTSEFAEIYNLSGKAFNELLASFNIQYKRKVNGKTKWIFKKAFTNKNLKVTKSSTYINQEGQVLTFKSDPKWTKKGILYIYYFLKEKKIEPKTLKQDKIEEKIEQLSFI